MWISISIQHTQILFNQINFIVRWIESHFFWKIYLFEYEVSYKYRYSIFFPPLFFVCKFYFKNIQFKNIMKRVIILFIFYIILLWVYFMYKMNEFFNTHLLFIYNLFISIFKNYLILRNIKLGYSIWIAFL